MYVCKCLFVVQWCVCFCVWCQADGGAGDSGGVADAEGVVRCWH